MKFETSRVGALKKLDSFINNNVLNYNSKRNFDYGINERQNVSCLSPYITHRLVTEYEVVKKVLAKCPFQKVDKYIQEIFWRIYWKGWLELRPQVWTDFTEDLNNLSEDDNYLRAINGETHIECFNEWVKELKDYNYLHNHTRMWFASIWIFTLNLPWQKGAEFFMQHLYDGDAASNTLSWRWVAGLQTKGKNYIAQSWNINRFTGNRFKDIKLNENALPLVDKREYKIKPLTITKNNNSSEVILLFENDLNLETLNLKNYKQFVCLLLNNDNRKIKVNEKVLSFKKKIIKDQINRLDKIKLIDEKIFKDLVKNVSDLDVIYPCVGDNLSFLKKFRKKHNINYNFITRNGDEFCWQFSNKGYFNFKTNIPKIMKKMNLSL